MRTNPRKFKFIQISTDEVYGSLNKDENPFTEKSLLKPSNPYSASKASADVIALSYYTTYGFPTIITRCSNKWPIPISEKLNLSLLTGTQVRKYQFKWFTNS